MLAHLRSKACLIETMKAVDPVTPDEFRKGLRIAQCIASYFDFLGLPCKREYLDKFVVHLLKHVDAGEAPPFNGAQASQAAEDTIVELWPDLTEEEKDSYMRTADEFSTKMVEAAPPEAQAAFAELVARAWAVDL